MSKLFLAICFGLLLGNVSLAQEASPEMKKLFDELQQKQLELKIQEVVAEQQRNQWILVREVDVDEDGVADVRVEMKHGRGMLSTYFTEFRLFGINGTRFMRNGVPHDGSVTLRPTDLLSTLSSIQVCSVGVSLRFPERPADDFCGGPWWDRSGKLAIAIFGDDSLKVGVTTMEVSRQGKIFFSDTDLKSVHWSVDF